VTHAGGALGGLCSWFITSRELAPRALAAVPIKLESEYAS
jgi:hypothetical protein